ncbi:hypothetical protein R3I93_010510 [Phoxinus phoxinus]|uniref:Uncharacterized protein n=1 Tax=Phoxinus phoxinus TaxID=58324 RepID=A0AAN9D0J8_9TELE
MHGLFTAHWSCSPGLIDMPLFLRFSSRRPPRMPHGLDFMLRREKNHSNSSCFFRVIGCPSVLLSDRTKRQPSLGHLPRWQTPLWQKGHNLRHRVQGY